jgi:hypothetical protein
MNMADKEIGSVNIYIEGIIPLLFKRAGNKIVECFIGAVKNVPDHEFKLVINGKEIDPGTIHDELHLQVQNTSQTDITLLNDDVSLIDRVTGGGDQKSFAWVLDFEGPEAYGRRIDVNKRQLGQTLRINQGVMSTTVISPNHLLKRLPHEAQWTLIGKVATKINARIDLDMPNSEAILINGNSPMPETLTKQGERLVIEISVSRPEDLEEGHSRHDHPEESHSHDANHYHLAIGPGLQAREKLIFSSTPMVPDPREVSPDASCLSGRMGTTEGG